MPNRRDIQLDYLIDYLQKESRAADRYVKKMNPHTCSEKLTTFRGLCNTRYAKSVTDEFLTIQDQFLQDYNYEQEIVKLGDLTPIRGQLYLWQGDITRLAVSSIVNAANSYLLGCTQANHYCIDNAIHTFSGVQLRLACHQIIEKQGHKEAMGKAKITPAYNLPSDYVIHTVGPYIDKRGVTGLSKHLLQSSYKASLKLADERKLDSIAFCCISTGEFHFPNELAAQIALETVKDYLRETGSTIKVIFNVYKDEDFHIYEQLLEGR